jgi:hypothetical protein
MVSTGPISREVTRFSRVSLGTRLSRLWLELNNLPRQPPLTEDQCHRFLSILTEIESVEDQIAALKSLSSTNSRANEDH